MGFQSSQICYVHYSSSARPLCYQTPTSCRVLTGTELMFRQTEAKKKYEKNHPFQPTVYLDGDGEITADWYADIPQTEQVFVTRGFLSF